MNEKLFTIEEFSSLPFLVYRCKYILRRNTIGITPFENVGKPETKEKR
jgi:hypothetical protein